MSPASEPPEAGYAILEHTADVGIRAFGPTLEAAFEQAAWGLVDLLDIRGEGAGEPRSMSVSASDEAALLVDLLNELILLHETEEVAVSSVEVERVGARTLDAEVSVVPLGRRAAGVVVKAATYHRLSVERTAGGGVEVRIYLDI